MFIMVIKPILTFLLRVAQNITHSLIHHILQRCPFLFYVFLWVVALPPVLQCCFRLQTFNLVFSITWSVSQSAPLISLSYCDVVLCVPLCLNRVLVTTRLYSESGVSRSSPSALHLPTPWLPSTPFHFSVSEPTLALKSRTSISLSSGGTHLIVSLRSL